VKFFPVLCSEQQECASINCYEIRVYKEVSFAAGLNSLETVTHT
jgi:competence transcription factor ComK